MGAAKEGLQPLFDAVAASDVPITQFLPTHVERTPALIQDGARWIKAGGHVDLTCRTHEVMGHMLRSTAGPEAMQESLDAYCMSLGAAQAWGNA